MTVRLRGHHLLCSLTFKGKGYSPAFVANYERVVARLSGGEDVLIVDGPDDICAPLLTEGDAHCHSAGIVTRDLVASHQVGDLLGLSISAGTRLVLNAAMVESMQSAFVDRSIREACARCEWSDLCSEIARDEFKSVKFVPAA